MKRGLIGFPLLVFLIQAVSAQFFGSYGRFSITDFFNSIDSETMILGLLFFIFFALLFYAASRIFKDQYGQPNKAIAGTISLALSLLIIYGIYRSGFGLGDLFYNIGIGTEILYFIVPIIFIALAVLLIKKIKIRGFLMVFGLFLILLTIFTDIFYEKSTAFMIGIVLLLIGLFLLWLRRRRGRKKLMGNYSNYGPSPQNPYEQRQDYERQRAEREYQRRLQKDEEKRRKKYIIKIGKERKRLEKKGEFQYSQGMRRGGLKPTRGRFVSKRAVERYARRFGADAAKKRFG